MASRRKPQPGDHIRSDYEWTAGGDIGDGVVEAVGKDWVVLREDYYDTPVLYAGKPSGLRHLIFDPRIEEAHDDE